MPKDATNLKPSILENFNRITRAIILPEMLGQQLLTQERKLFSNGNELTPFLANRVATLDSRISEHEYEAATIIQSAFRRTRHHTLPDPDSGFCGILNPEKTRLPRKGEATYYFNKGQIIGWFKHAKTEYQVQFLQNPLTPMPVEKGKTSGFKCLVAKDPAAVRLHTRDKEVIVKTDDDVIQTIKGQGLRHLVIQHLVLPNEGVYVAKNLGVSLYDKINSGIYFFDLNSFLPVLLELEQLHRLGYCLRDIKPENAFLVNGEIYFTDLDSAVKQGNEVRIEGTEHYGSPLVFNSRKYGVELDKLCLLRTLFCCYRISSNFQSQSSWNHFIRDLVLDEYASLINCFLNVYTMEIPELSSVLKFNHNQLNNSETECNSADMPKAPFKTIGEEVEILKNLNSNRIIISDEVTVAPLGSLANQLNTMRIRAYGIFQFKPLIEDLEILHQSGLTLECITTQNITQSKDGGLKIEISPALIQAAKQARKGSRIPAINYDKLCIIRILCEFYYREELRNYGEAIRQHKITYLLPEFIERFINPDIHADLNGFEDRTMLIQARYAAQNHLKEFVANPEIACAQLSDMINFNVP